MVNLTGKNMRMTLAVLSVGDGTLLCIHLASTSVCRGYSSTRKMMANERINGVEGSAAPSLDATGSVAGTSIDIDTGPNSVELRESKPNRKFEEDVAENQELGPLEDRIAKDSVITIDTTDKRHHRSALRAQHTYAAKKTVAQGMMDVALITANANQLRYLVEYQRNSPTFFVNVFLIVVSLLLQIGVGVSLIFKGRFDIRGKGKSPQALKINNYVVVGVFLITIINVFVAAFSVSASPAAPSTLRTSA